MEYDVIILGGSYAGMSAAMALGRSIRKVLVIDSGQPCNRQTPHSHNFLTQDGKTPKEISDLSKEQVLRYPTIRWIHGTAVRGKKETSGFSIQLENGESYSARKLLFATGVRDVLPDLPGLAECWGISVLHCPYCHGYEVKQTKIGLLGNGDMGFEFSKLIRNWTSELVLFTNGHSTLSPDQRKKIDSHSIRVVEDEIFSLDHHDGYLKQIIFKNGKAEALEVLFARGTFAQNSEIPRDLGCEFTELGYILVNDFQQTNISGVYAAGDNTTIFRSVATAVAAGNKAGALLNKELVDDDF